MPELPIYRKFAKKKLLNFGSEVILKAKQWFHFRQRENIALLKPKAHYWKRTSDIEEREARSIDLEAEGVGLENRVNPRTRSEGVHSATQHETLNGSDSIVASMKSERKISITVHSSSACDTLPSVQ